MSTESYQCLCGLAVSSEMTENHLEICPMAVLECKFSAVGCEEKVHRKDQDEHDSLGTQKHLQLVAAATVSGCQQLYSITCEQGKLISDVDERGNKSEMDLYQKVQQMEKKINALEHKMVSYQQEKEIMMLQLREVNSKAQVEKKKENQVIVYQEFCKELEAKLKSRIDQHQQVKIQEIEEKLVNLMKHYQTKKSEEHDKEKKTVDQDKVSDELQLCRKLDSSHPFSKPKKSGAKTSLSFVIKNFTMQWGSNNWKSPAMYTHNKGYKFTVSIDMSKAFRNGEKGIDIEFNHSSTGEYNKMLKWPVRVDFTYELYNDRKEKLYSSTYSANWEEYRHYTHKATLYCSEDAIPLKKIVRYIQDDLHFIITNITMS